MKALKDFSTDQLRAELEQRERDDPLLAAIEELRFAYATELPPMHSIDYYLNRVREGYNKRGKGNH